MKLSKLSEVAPLGRYTWCAIKEKERITLSKKLRLEI
jgi:hypothetical protein